MQKFTVLSIFILSGCGATVAFAPQHNDETDSAVVMPDAATTDANTVADATPSGDGASVEAAVEDAVDGGSVPPTGFADLIVDRQFRAPSSTVRSGVGRTTFLTLAVVNDGASTGTLDRMTFDVRAVVMAAETDERPASIRDVASACYVVHDGNVLATGRIDGDQIVFSHAHIAVGTSYRGTDAWNFFWMEIACDVRLNESVLPLYGAIRVWFSANWHTGFTMEEAPPSRVQGTLNLAMNVPGHDGETYVQVVR